LPSLPVTIGPGIGKALPMLMPSSRPLVPHGQRRRRAELGELAGVRVHPGELAGEVLLDPGPSLRVELHLAGARERSRRQGTVLDHMGFGGLGPGLWRKDQGPGDGGAGEHAPQPPCGPPQVRAPTRDE
jgi:hypothetical protein